MGPPAEEKLSFSALVSASVFGLVLGALLACFEVDLEPLWRPKIDQKPISKTVFDFLSETPTNPEFLLARFLKMLLFHWFNKHFLNAAFPFADGLADPKNTKMTPKTTQNEAKSGPKTPPKTGAVKSP